MTFTQYDELPAECPEFAVDSAQRISAVFSQHKRTFAAPVRLLMWRMYSVPGIGILGQHVQGLATASWPPRFVIPLSTL